MTSTASGMKRVAQVAVTAAALSLAVVPAAPPATANVVANNAATSYTGEGFDIYTAQPTSKLRGWLGSPYRAVGAYVGGVNRFDPVQPNLNGAWVQTVSAAGWRIIPAYVGLQAPCTTSNKKHRIDPAQAAAQGRGSAADAVASMQALGLGGGNPVYFDMEPWNYDNAACRTAVSQFLDGWTYRLHTSGYKAGVYGGTTSTMKLLVSQYTSTTHRRPDDIWFARYDQRDTTTGEPTIPDSYWPHHRIHQYAGNVQQQSYNDVTLTIDKNAVDGDVADPSLVTAPKTYAVSGTQGSPGLTERSAPSPSAPAAGTYPEGAQLPVTCQIGGDAVYGDSVWDRLQDGNYVADVYTTTPGGNTWAGTLPRCDGTPAGHLDNPPNNVTVEAGRALTLGGWFATGALAPPLTGVTFSVSTNGSTWTPVGTDSHGGDGHYQVTWSPAWTRGAPVQVRATAANGVTTGTSNVRAGVRVVDTTPPRVTPATPPPAVLTRYVRLAWSAVDAGAGVRSSDVRYQKSSYAGTFGAWTSPTGWTATTATHEWLAVAPGYDYCFEVRARDNVGNLSVWSSRRCVARALDDRSLSIVTSGWSRRTGPAFYMQTYTATTALGRVLSRSGARLVRVGVVATTCVKCGAVSVYVNGRWVGRVSLVSPVLRRQQILMLPRFSYRTGTVTVRTVTSAKAVQVDGLLLSRT